VERVVYSPDGRYFAASAPDEALIVWEVAGWRKVATLKSASGGFISFAFHPDCERLVTCEGSTGVATWKITVPERPTAAIPLPNAVRVAFAPDGRRVLVGKGDGHVCLVDPDSGVIQDLGEAHHGLITAIVPDYLHGRFFTAGMSATDNVAVWDAKTLRLQRFFIGHRMSVNALALSTDGTLLASAGEERIVIVWNAATGEAVTRLASSANSIWSYGAPEPRGTGALDLAFATTGADLLAAYDDGRVIVWHLNQGKGGELHAHLGAVFAVGMRPGTTRFASAGSDGKVRFWNLAQTHPASRLLVPEASSRYLGLSADGKTLFAAESTRVRAWDVTTGQEQPSTGWSSDDSPRVAAFSASSGQVALTFDDRADRGTLIRSGANFQQVRSLTEARSEPGKAAFDPHGYWFAARAVQAPLAVWDLRDKQSAAVPCDDMSSEPSAVAFASDGSWLIAGSREGPIRVWDADSHHVVATVEHPPAYWAPTAVGGHHAAKIVAAGYLLDGTVACWSLADPGHPRLLAVTHEHAPRSSIGVFAFNERGTCMLSLGSEGDASFWQLPAVVPLAHFREFGDGYAHALPFNAEGTLAVSSGRGGLLLYDLSIGAWVADALALAGRMLSEEEKRAFLQPAP
jgi:WD40 repeat protein